MIENAVFSMSFRNVEEALGVDDMIGVKPYRSYNKNKEMYVLMYDMANIYSNGANDDIILYVKKTKKSKYHC